MVAHHSEYARPAPSPRTGAQMMRSPFVVVVAVLAVLAAIVWAVALSDRSSESAATSCPPPAGGDGNLSALPVDELDTVAPARLSDATFRVLNANGQSGQAGAVAAQLGELGFHSAGAAAVGNDTVYAGQDLQCHGQIRFGNGGRSAARSLSIAAPCMELVTDDRADASVDLVLGRTFAQLTQSPPALGVLDSLKAGDIPEAEQVTKARSTTC